MKATEAKLGNAIIELLQLEGDEHASRFKVDLLMTKEFRCGIDVTSLPSDG